MEKSGWLKKLKHKGIEIHARSIFLQGLLLLPKDKLPKKFLRYKKLFKDWYNWLDTHHDINSKEACISYIKSLSEIDKIIIGFNNVSEIKEIIKIYKSKKISRYKLQSKVTFRATELEKIMKIVAIIQARMSSKRLPGKVLLPLCGYPVIEHVVRRVKECKKINTIVVATSKSKADWPIVNWCKKNKINFFQGSLNDVLDRYYKASILFKADIIVRVTGDCPVIDPKILDEVIIRFKKKIMTFIA